MTVSAALKTGNPGVSPNLGTFEVVSSFAIGGSTTAPGLGTATYFRHTYRDLDWAIIRFEVNQTAAGSAGSGDYLLPMPTGLTIDYARLASTGPTNAVLGYCGDGELNNGATFYIAKCYSANNGVYANKIAIFLSNDTVATTSWGSGTAPASSGVLKFSCTIRVPIVEWATTQFTSQGAGLATATRYGLGSGNTGWAGSDASGTIGAGKLGEKFNGTILVAAPTVSSGANAYTDISGCVAPNVTPGEYMILATGKANVTAASGSPDIRVAVRDASNNVMISDEFGESVAAGQNYRFCIMYPLKVTVTQNFKLSLFQEGGTSVTVSFGSTGGSVQFIIMRVS